MKAHKKPTTFLPLTTTPTKRSHMCTTTAMKKCILDRGQPSALWAPASGKNIE